MKVMTLFGTRPEIIRLSQVIKQLDQICEQILVHTGQNYDPNLSDIFFRDLEVRAPDIHMGIQANDFASQAGQIITQAGKILAETKPDRLLILGDTNSGLAAIVAARLGIPVYHMEAGNRCYDDRVPEEINRRIIDHTSNVLMPYTERSRMNLLREGIPGNRVFVIGNPIKEVLDCYSDSIQASPALKNLNLQVGDYFLVTLHRAENVDIPERLGQFIEAFQTLHEKYAIPVICSLHPRTRSQLKRNNQQLEQDGIVVVEPLSFFDFVHLEQRARCVLSDSGTVQEECCIFHVPNVTIRDVTERPETVEVGSNILSGSSPESIMRCVQTALSRPPNWNPPPEYLVPHTSQTVLKIVLGHQERSLDR